MSNQPLFDALEMTRPSHPETSFSAAEKIAPARHMMSVRAALMVRQFPNRTGAELDKLAGVLNREVSKRLADACDKYCLIRRGRKRICTVGGNMAITWEPVE